MRSLSGQCAPDLQRAAALYNPQLVQMINGLNSEIGAKVFIAANTQQQTNDFISNPRAYGKYLHNSVFDHFFLFEQIDIFCHIKKNANIKSNERGID